MDPISFAASIVAIIQLTGTVVGYLNDVKDAPKDRARCATEASNLFNLLNNLKYRLEEADTNQPWYTAVRALAAEDGPFDQYKSMLEQLRPKVNAGSRIRKVGNTLLWNFSKQEVNVVLSRMERLKSLILIALEMDHFKLSRAIKASIDNLHNNNQAIKEDTSIIRQAIPTLEKGAHAIQQEQKRQRHRIIADWISPVDFAAQQSDVISRRQEGTGLWFLNSPEFLKWLHNSNQTLFCPGIPGSGKTMITAITVDHLWKYMQNTDIGVAYVYYNYKRQADQTTANLAATILKQLIHGQPSAAEPVVILYERHADRRTRPSLEEIRSALRAVISNYSKVYIVIDALDECLDHDGSRSQFLALLRDLQSRGDLNLMVTSRFIPQVLQTFRLSPMLEVRASESDVKTFVAGQIYRLPRCVQRDDELQKAIQDGISTAVDGMFLLARLHIDSLLDKSTKKKILSTLDGLPKGSKALDEAYNDAIERIESQLPGNSALARSVLSWITYAQRPLTTGELSHALALDIGDSELDPDNIPDVEDMVSVCVGLVTVDDESEVIRLVHYTTQEYFERIRETWNTNAQKEIASTCLNYLSLSPFMNGSAASDEDWERRLTQNVFFDYASQNWAYHTFPVQEEVMKIALSFLQNGNLIDSASQPACRSNYRYSGYSQKFTKGVTGLHLAAGCELLSLLQDMLRTVNENVLMDADCADSDRRTPLSWAAEMGHKAVVKLLVERDDVDVNSKDYDGRTPLWWAAAKGHEDVVKLLVKRDNVEADSKDYNGRTPLSEAAAQGHDNVVKLLVERDDVEADSKGWQGQTPLSRAAEQGHEAAVKLLVKRDDVEADLKDLRGRAPLLRAAENGHEAVVKLLLERGDVEADSKDNDRRTPLFEAAENGHEAVVKLLLKQDDIEADVKDNYGHTPLSVAAERGHEAVVKLLVKRGDVTADSKDMFVRTPLANAAASGHEAVVKLLVERDDVEVESKDWQGRTPLSGAAATGKEAVVKLLVERDDVEADLKDNAGRTPLSCAAAEGKVAAVKLLVERDDVEADSKDNAGRTPLSWAAAGGNEAVVKLLVERDDVEADLKDNTGRTPLSWAAAEGHEAVVKLLIERDDVEADSKDSDDRTPLWWAAAEGEFLVEKLLKERDDVKTDLKDKYGRTPLWWAEMGYRKPYISAHRNAPLNEWNIMTAILQSTLTDHSRWLEAVAFSPNVKQVASGSWDKTVKVWDATTGPVAFSADGTQVALGSEHDTIKLWDVAKYLKASRLLGNTFSRPVKFRTCQSIKTSEPVRNSPRLG